jgi:hypothetical protein
MEALYDKKYNLRLPSKVFERIEELGAKYDRSINEQIVYMLKTWQEPSAFDDRLTKLENYIYEQQSRKSASGE